MASGALYWTVHDVKRWIRSWDVLYGHFATNSTIHNLLKFVDVYDIDGEALVYFTKDELKTYGLDKHDISVTIKCIDELIIGSYIDYMMDNSYHFFPKSLPPKQQLLVHLPPKPTDTQQEIMAYDHQHNQLEATSTSTESKQQTDIEVEDGWEIPFTYPKPSNVASGTTQSSASTQNKRAAVQPHTASSSTNPFHSGHASAPAQSSSRVPSRSSTNPNPMNSRRRIPQNQYIENNAQNQAALASIASNQQVHHASRSAMNDKNVQSAAWNAYRGSGNDPNANRQLVGALAKNKEVQRAAVSVAKDEKVQKAVYQGVKKNATKKNAKKAKRLLSFHM